MLEETPWWLHSYKKIRSLLVRRLFTYYKGNGTACARSLGVSYRTFKAWYVLSELELQKGKTDVTKPD